jgi:hypothetical protein
VGSPISVLIRLSPEQLYNDAYDRDVDKEGDNEGNAVGSGIGEGDVGRDQRGRRRHRLGALEDE